MIAYIDAYRDRFGVTTAPTWNALLQPTLTTVLALKRKPPGQEQVERAVVARLA